MENLNEEVAEVVDMPETDIEAAQNGSNIIALPQTAQGLMEYRKSAAKKSLNDQVEFVHLNLWDVSKEYQSLWDAVQNSQAIEGSTTADDYAAAGMLRQYAKDNAAPYVARQNLTTLKFALGVVMRRFGMSRKERREQ